MGSGFGLLYGGRYRELFSAEPSRAIDLNLGYYQFNRSMRLLANKKGFSLNQRGLWSGVFRDPKTRQKTAAGEVLLKYILCVR
jgi:hypothetical protein